MKEIINCNIPIRFPIKPNTNCICFTPESLKDIGTFLENAPIVRDGNAVGILSGNYKLIEKENETIVLADAKLWIECNPEVTVCKIKKDNDINVVESFILNSVSL